MANLAAEKHLDQYVQGLSPEWLAGRPESGSIFPLLLNAKMTTNPTLCRRQLDNEWRKGGKRRANSFTWAGTYHILGVVILQEMICIHFFERGAPPEGAIHIHLGKLG